MSIHAAVTELNKEIERLAKIRDSLLSGVSIPGAPVAPPAAKKATPTKKRVLSAAARKKISEATKRRWAAQKKAAATAK